MSRTFTKHGTFKATDNDRQIALGAALIPDSVDRQGDWFRGKTITALADDYVARLPDGDAEQGVMHVKFEVDDITLVENRVLDEPETVGDDEFAAGTWLLGYQIHDDDLWSLVEDEILAGFSIGGTIPDGGENAQPVADLPEDVTVPDTATVDSDDDGNATVAEITDATIHEVSLVDVPAVPDATVSMTKAAREVAKDGSLTDPERAEQALRDRGHSEEDAALLADYLTKYNTDKTDDTMTDDDTADDDTDLEDVDDATLGKRLKRLLLGVDDTDKDGSTGPDDGDDAALDMPEVPGGAVSKALHIAKEGRTLNESNQRDLMAAHDAIESALTSEVDFAQNRFTDDSGVDFSVDEYGAEKAVDGDTGDDAAAEKSFDAVLKELTDAQVALVGEAIQQFVDAQGEADVAVLREWLWNHRDEDTLNPDILTALDVALEDFYDEQHPDNQQVTGTFADWVSEQASGADVELAVDAAADKDADEEAAVDADADADTEKTDMTDDDTTDDTETNSTEKDEPPAWAADMIETVDDLGKRVEDVEQEVGVEKSIEDAPEWAQTLSAKVDDLDERLDRVSKATADTTQAAGGEATGDEDADATWTDKNSPFVAGGS